MKRMKKVLSLALTLALCLGLLNAAALAATDFLVPESHLGLRASANSTGTTQYTTEDGVTGTVLLFPVGTEFGGMVYDIRRLDGEMEREAIFRLPAEGVYEIELMDAWLNMEWIWVSADSTGSSAAEDPAEPEEQPSAEPEEQPSAEPEEQPSAEPEEQPSAEPEEQPSDWAVPYVEQAKAAGIIPEELQGAYTAPITRAEYCALATALYESIKGEITDRKTFVDTTDVNVEKMAAVGVVDGVGENKFEPDNRLTREQAATMMARLAKAMDKPIPAAAASFADSSTVSSWAIEAVGQMEQSGIMNGTGNNCFSPAEDYTREQSIITMVRMMEYVK